MSFLVLEIGWNRKNASDECPWYENVAGLSLLNYNISGRTCSSGRGAQLKFKGLPRLDVLAGFWAFLTEKKRNR